jgi:septin family protein
VPWAVNQVYWRARAVFDRVLKSGERLRDAQVAALEGRKADVRAATDAHRKAIGEAVREATAIAGAEGSQPAADELMRTFEAISLAPDRDEAPGRWTKPLKPAGFEALSGVKVAPKTVAKIEEQSEKEKVQSKKAVAEHKKAEAARKKHEAEIKKAEAALERARRKMAEAEATLKKTKST